MSTLFYLFFRLPRLRLAMTIWDNCKWQIIMFRNDNKVSHYEAISPKERLWHSRSNPIKKNFIFKFNFINIGLPRLYRGSQWQFEFCNDSENRLSITKFNYKLAEKLLNYVNSFHKSIMIIHNFITFSKFLIFFFFFLIEIEKSSWLF